MTTTQPENQTTEIKNNANKVLVLYSLMVDEINSGCIVGIKMWSEELIACMAHIELDNNKLFKRS